MTELEQAIAKTIANGLMSAGYHDAADYVLSDWMAGAISRATGQLVPAQAWQGMDSAPKDELILLWGYLDPIPDQRELYVYLERPTRVAGYWEDIDQSWAVMGSTWEGPFFNPTHWMPLPPPPAEGV